MNNTWGFAKEHPVATFFIVFVICSSIEGIVEALVNCR